ncbi:MAG: hypothetical protein DWQ08_06975, partial [Proteobacteria bacterium]
MTGIRPLPMMPGNRRKVVCRHGHARYIDPSWVSILADCGLAPDADWSALSPGVRVSESKVTNCFRVDHPVAGSFYFKRYVYTRYKKLRYFMRPSKASNEVFGYRQLAELGIPTLEVVAFSEHRLFGRLVSACVVTRGIDGSRDLETFAREEWSAMTSADRQQALQLIRETLFTQVRRAHAANFFHQDLHWRNLLLVDDVDGGYRIHWIDCPRARYQRLRRNPPILADLAPP